MCGGRLWYFLIPRVFISWFVIWYFLGGDVASALLFILFLGMRLPGIVLAYVAPDKTDRSVRILGTIIYLGAGGSDWLIKCGALVAFFVNESLHLKGFNLVESDVTKNVLYGSISWPSISFSLKIIEVRFRC